MGNLRNEHLNFYRNAYRLGSKVLLEEKPAKEHWNCQHVQSRVFPEESTIERTYRLKA